VRTVSATAAGSYLCAGRVLPPRAVVPLSARRQVHRVRALIRRGGVEMAKKKKKSKKGNKKKKK
jgi:hypothetical protein